MPLKDEFNTCRYCGEKYHYSADDCYSEACQPRLIKEEIERLKGLLAAAERELVEAEAAIAADNEINPYLLTGDELARNQPQ